MFRSRDNTICGQVLLACADYLLSVRKALQSVRHADVMLADRLPHLRRGEA